MRTAWRWSRRSRARRSPPSPDGDGASDESIDPLTRALRPNRLYADCRRRLAIRLYRREIIDDVRNPDPVHPIVRIERAEDRAPHRHVARAVCRWNIPISGQQRLDARFRKHAVIARRDPRQIGRWHAQSRGDRTLAVAVAAMTRRAVELEEVASRNGRDYQRRVRWARLPCMRSQMKNRRQDEQARKTNEDPHLA